MAGTVTYNGASFSGAGTSDTSFTATSAPNTYNVNNNNFSTITNLGFQDNSATGVFLNVTSKTSLTNDKSSFAFADGNDTLLIGSSRDSYYTTGNGVNNLRFTYGSTGDTINTGSDADQLIFGGKISNTLIQLQVDSVTDTIKIANNTMPVNGLKITGATDIDVLFIGSTKYTYNSNDGAWINDANPTDKKFYN